jgi:hypothetical protein
MPSIEISISSRRPFGRAVSGQRGVRRLSDFIAAINAGAIQGDSIIYSVNDDATLRNVSGVASQSVALLAISSGSGSVGATIDGTAATATWATSDTNSALLVQTAINTTAALRGKVYAGSPLGVTKLTVGTLIAGDAVQVFGITFTARTAATISKADEFPFVGTAATDATALANSINAHPALVSEVRAVAVGAIVYVCLTELPVDISDPFDTLRLMPNAAGTLTANITINNAVPTNLGVLPIVAACAGPIGDCITCVASGTGVTVTTVNAGKLGAGGGGGSTRQQPVTIHP